MNPKEIVNTSEAPNAIGPYSQAVKVNKMVYLSGQIAIDPKTQQFIDGRSGLLRGERSLGQREQGKRDSKN